MSKPCTKLGFLERPDPGTLDFRFHGALEQLDGHNNAKRAFDLMHDALDAGEGAIFNQHQLSDLEEGTWSYQQARLYQRTHAADLTVRDRAGTVRAESND
jgi:hypothetical protein